VTDVIKVVGKARQEIDLGKITKTYQEAGPKVKEPKTRPKVSKANNTFRYHLLTNLIRFGNRRNLFFLAG
jgi:hypothetical protein